MDLHRVSAPFRGTRYTTDGLLPNSGCTRYTRSAFASSTFDMALFGIVEIAYGAAPCRTGIGASGLLPPLELVHAQDALLHRLRSSDLACAPHTGTPRCSTGTRSTGWHRPTPRLRRSDRSLWWDTPRRSWDARNACIGWGSRTSRPHRDTPPRDPCGTRDSRTRPDPRCSPSCTPRAHAWQPVHLSRSITMPYRRFASAMATHPPSSSQCGTACCASPA